MLPVSPAWAGKVAGAQAVTADGIAVNPVFRTQLKPLLVPGTMVVVTPDSLSSGSTGMPVTLLSDAEEP